MGCFEVFAFLFSGIGGTLVVAWLFHRNSYASHQINDHTRITTPRSAHPTVYQPVYEPPPPPPTESLPQMPTSWNAGATLVEPEPGIVTLEPGEVYGHWNVPVDGNQGVYYEPHVNFGVDPTIHFPQAGLVTEEEPTPVADYLTGNLKFDPAVSKLVNFDDDSISVVGNDRFIYADKEEGVLLASKYDADKWEEVEFKKTEKEITYKLRKK